MIVEGLGLCLGAASGTLRGDTQLMLLWREVFFCAEDKTQSILTVAPNLFIGPWLTSGRCLSDRGTDLENYLNGPKQLHLEVHMCQYKNCKMHCTNLTLYTQVSSSAGSLPCCQLIICGSRELASL